MKFPIFAAALAFSLAACGEQTSSNNGGAPHAAAPETPLATAAESAPLDEVGDAAPQNSVAIALSKPPAPMRVLTPDTNARRGRILFVTNGCVICHQVNDVGGRAAPPLDGDDDTDVDPLDFSARMWRGASAMSALQSIELGYVIELDGQDIADLAAFTESKSERSLLTLKTVSREMQDWFLDTPYWKTQNWDEYLKRGDRLPFDEDIPEEE
ncbi:MAG: c-type cytochrome [Pseudomonadota bacterium]